MTTTEFLSKMRSLRVKFKAVDDKLEINAPPGVLTSKLRKELAEHKTEILKFLQWSAQAATSETTIVPRQSGEELALSFAQQRLWYLNQLEPESHAYNMTLSFRLKGAVDFTSLEKSIQTIVQRHEVLRTQFPAKNGLPSQVISEIVPSLGWRDLRDLPEAEREEVAQGLVRKEARKPFDLARGPLLRATLLQLFEQEYVFLLVMHHIISDGWSLGIFSRELASCYEALTLNQPISLPALPIQYGDFAKWQRQWLKDEELEKQLSYWRNQLENIQRLQLPTDYGRPAVPTSNGAQWVVSIPKRLTDDLHALSHKEGLTLAITLLAAFQVLMARYTGRVDIAVGSPIANRNREEIEGLIGFFVNSLVMRTDLSGNPSFREVLARVQEVSLGAYEHQDLPFEKLVEELQPDRDLNQNPLFQVLFGVQNTPYKGITLPGLTVSPFKGKGVSSVFDMECHIREIPQGLVVSFLYSTDLFKESTISRMGLHFRNLLEGMVQNPEERIWNLPLLGKEERQKVLVELNKRKGEFSNAWCIHELFERQVNKTSHKIALVGGDRQFTYEQLNRRANQLGHYLRKLGVGPEARVGLCIDRSPEMIIGMLGILKAGGAYVPIDPEYPQDRLNYLVKEGSISALVTLDKFQSLFSVSGSHAICLDSEKELIGKEGNTNLEVSMTHQNLAYVIFTSGSTGSPKGVMVQHQALVNFVQGALEDYGIKPEDRILQFASFSFDASIEQIFASLSIGGTLVLRSDSMVDSVEEFLSCCQQWEISVLDLPTAFWHVLADRMGQSDLRLSPSVRMVIIGGERALQERLQEWEKKVGPTVRLVNSYGPTEATVVATQVEISNCGLGRQGLQEIPIGRPLPNVKCFVLDKWGQPLPIGLTGELYIGGQAVAIGYLDRPDLTAEKFLPNPYCSEPGSRMYATGDRARFLQDGSLEFRGRVDKQIKIRGYRVELGEIEATLRQHPEVQDAVVVAKDGLNKDSQLVGYVVPRSGTTREGHHGTHWRNFLLEKLPQFMVPQAFVELESLPLTTHEKIDYRALPAPGREEAGLETLPTLPRNPIEESLAKIWQEVLGVDEVSIHDNFFEVGGHSLFAIQVVSRVQEVWKVELPLRNFFKALTVAELARLIEHDLPSTEGIEVLPLVPCSRKQDLPLSFAQQRMWFLHQMEPKSPAYNMPFVRRLQGPLDREALEKSFCEIVRRHEALRTSFPSIDGKPSQVISETLAPVLIQHDLSDLPSTDREMRARQLAKEEGSQPFDLSTGPVMRTKLVKLEEMDHLLLITMHHIVSDGWSHGVLWKELVSLYGSFLRHESPSLSPLPIQYADFAHWQRQWLSGEVFEKQLDYWRHQLKDIPVLQLPTDRPHAAIKTCAGGRHKIFLPKSLMGSLYGLSRQEGVTLAVTLLAAFQVLLSRYTGQTDIAVGSPIANRNRREIEGLIGFFVNSLVMRMDLTGNPSFREVLARAQDVALEAYDHQDLPFERIVEELQPERDSSQNPLFQVIFAVQNAPFHAASLSGLKTLPFPSGGTTTRFDLECHVVENPRGLDVGFFYNRDLFDAQTIERFGRHFNSLLECVTRDPAQRISHISLVEESERKKVLVDWNATQTVYPRDATIADRFEERVSTTPDAVAVVFEGQSLTYQDLNTRANRLAHYLCQQGVGPEVCVGLCMERSLEMVVGILGILKAGGAYVPLDPQLPTGRLAFMLQDADIAMVLTQDVLRAHLPADWAGQVVALDTEWTTIAQMPDTNVASSVTAENLAYIMYTSGSTGLPKGTSISQRNVVRLVTKTNYLNFGPEETFLQFAPLAFDASTLELWGSLLHGAKLVLFPPLTPSLEELGHCLHEHGISALWLTAALFHQMVDSQLERLCGVRHLLAGGDVLSVPHVQRVLANLPQGGRLINGYGPTENTTFTCCHVMEPGNEVRASVPIGKPIANTQVYVLDRTMQPVPVGVYGELYIGGDGLGRNYLKRPTLTAEKFVPHPFSTEPGARLYKTGDEVRYRADGAIEFKGRVDHQVKVRGYRVELGEIEAVLSQHPAVAQTVAMVREDAPDDKRLVAYVVPDHDQSEALIQAEGREWAEQHIADWRLLYEQTYGERPAMVDPTFNISGWNSSYTGGAIPLQEMQEWVEATVGRIRGLHPKNVLEIGCGTGLLLYRIAPSCDQYVATDFSDVALKQIQAVQDSRTDLSQVRLEHRLADNFEGLEPSAFDTVIINSVTQYLPSMDYLVRILEGATRVVKPGGHIFVGDVRSLPLLAAHHASVQLHQADDSLSTLELEKRIQQALLREEELVIAPEFFQAIQQHLPRIGHVEVLLKQGTTHNELTKFRYDVILHLDASSESKEEVQWLEWGEKGLSLEGIQKLLQEQQPLWVGVAGIPNARISKDVRILEWFSHGREPIKVRELRQSLQEKHGEAVDSQSLWEAVSGLPYWTELGYAGSGTDGSMTAVFRRYERGQRPPRVMIGFKDGRIEAKPWKEYGTDPLKAKMVRNLVPQLREFLKVKVPEYLVPAAFAILDELPLTPNGKVDRRALPVPEVGRCGLGGSLVPPRTPLEKEIARIWCDVLGIDQVSIHDNFFELGGHSLLATQVISRLRDAVHIDLKLRHFFDLPTIADLADGIDALGGKSNDEGPFRIVGDTEEIGII